jgi:hypothetical protein
LPGHYSFGRLLRLAPEVFEDSGPPIFLSSLRALRKTSSAAH